MRSLPKIDNFLKLIETTSLPVVLVVHDQADLDAIGSAIAIREIIAKINSKLEISTLKVKLNILAKNLLKYLEYDLNFIEYSQIPPNMILIYIDCQSTRDPVINSHESIVFDHHIDSNLLETEYNYISPEFTSTAELIATFFYKYNMKINSDVATSLLSGIIFDTRRFMRSDSDVFDLVSKLTKIKNLNYSEVVSICSGYPSYSERIACIKAAQRIQRREINGLTIVLSHVSSYEASAARKLLYIGGEMVFVVSSTNQGTRISFRSTNNFYTKTEISLGKDIIPYFIKSFGGDGGGHNCAAGYNSREKLEIKELKRSFLKILDELMLLKTID